MERKHDPPCDWCVGPQVQGLKDDETVTGGMIPKLEMAAHSVNQGVEGSVILDGRVPHAVLLQLLSDKAVGTLVGKV